MYLRLPISLSRMGFPDIHTGAVKQDLEYLMHTILQDLVLSDHLGNLAQAPQI